MIIVVLVFLPRISHIKMAEVAVRQTLFRAILDRIRQLRFLTTPARQG